MTGDRFDSGRLQVAYTFPEADHTIRDIYHHARKIGALGDVDVKLVPPDRVRLSYCMPVAPRGTTRQQLQKHASQLGARGAIKIRPIKAMPKGSIWDLPEPEVLGVPVADSQVLALLKLSTITSVPPFGREDLAAFADRGDYHGNHVTSAWRISKIGANEGEVLNDWREADLRESSTPQDFARRLHTFTNSAEITQTGWESLINIQPGDDEPKVEFDSFLEFLDQAFHNGRGGYTGQALVTFRFMKRFAIEWWRMAAVKEQPELDVQSLWDRTVKDSTSRIDKK